MKKVIVSIFLFVGCLGIGGAIFSRVYEQNIRAWPQQAAQIERSEIRAVQNNEGGVTYSADVVYSYQVGGETYTSMQLGIGNFTTTSRSLIREKIAPFPAGAEVMAFVNPEDPGEAMLQPDTGLFFWIFAGIGSVFALFGLILGFIVPAHKFRWHGVRWDNRDWDHNEFNH